jgi:hypothetical protein
MDEFADFLGGILDFATEYVSVQTNDEKAISAQPELKG